MSSSLGVTLQASALQPVEALVPPGVALRAPASQPAEAPVSSSRRAALHLHPREGGRQVAAGLVRSVRMQSPQQWVPV